MSAVLPTPAQIGHDGFCDFGDGGCEEVATICMLTPDPPQLWSADARPASLGFVCEEHYEVQPIAALADAMAVAEYIDPDCTAALLWEQLLARYPEPVRYE